jgi:transposase
MSRYRPYSPPQPLLLGYDPLRDLPPDHLAFLVEQVVEDTVHPSRRADGPGQPPYDPRLCVKVLVYGYATGVRSSRQLERHCRETLPYLLLTRGEAPSYRTLCTARTEEGEYLEAVWEGLFAVAAAVGLERLGRVTVDSTKIRADASPEAVLKREEFAAMRAEWARILAEAAQVDAREAAEGSAGQTELGTVVAREQMRDILRRVRQQRRQEARAAADRAGKPSADDPPGSPPAGGGGATGTLPLETPPAQRPPAATPAAPAPPMTPKMLQRVVAGLQAIAAAVADGREQLCLTDPEARMMYGERRRGVREAYSFEVAVDNGLLVVGQATQEGSDNARLEPLVAAAARHEPQGVRAAEGDAGYYAGEAVGRLLAAGVDVCVPDSNTASDLHRGLPIGTTRARSRGSVPFTYDAAADLYRCPEGNRLVRTQRRRENGQERTVYRAQAVCTGCARAAECLRTATAKHRTLRVGDDAAVLAAAQQRFATPAYQERYRHRGEMVETVFGFLRGTLGYGRWILRGAQKVKAEARLLKTAYQFRKVHQAWGGA